MLPFLPKRLVSTRRWPGVAGRDVVDVTGIATYFTVALTLLRDTLG
jgi:hypothetical protein